MDYAQLPKTLIDDLIILQTDRDNIITYISPNMCFLTGYTEEEAVGQKPDIFKDPSYSRGFVKEMWNELEKNHRWQGIVRNKRKDGSLYYKNTIVYKDFDENGIHSGYYCLCIDTTEETEKNIKLKELNKTKNDFFANFSHEIRTPLNATIGFIELMKDQITDHTLNEYMNIILDNSKHLLDMMNDVIDFTSIDNDNLDIVPREFSPKDIQSTIEIFYAKSLEKEIDFTAFISPQLPERITQDILRIKQVISNLLSNAMKFTDYGGKIVIDVYNDKKNLYITVEDSGIGMTQEQQQKVFSPYQQAADDTGLRYGGTGLGLAVVKKIVEKMRGNIKVESKIYEGTKFKISLPISDYVEKTLITKLDIKNVYLYIPSFSKDKRDILKRYVRHFTDANIIPIKIIKEHKITDSDIVIVFKDDIEVSDLENLTQSSRILLLKKFNDILISDNLNETNIQEINLPLMGSKLYDALYSLVNNKILVKSLNKIELPNTADLDCEILLAEDMKANVYLMKNIFDKFNGLRYKIVSNGKEVVNEYIQSIKNGSSRFDMVFLDENMPVLSGSKAAQKIREYEKTNRLTRVPLIALTANRYGSKDNNLLVDMDEYVSKPLDIKELFSIVLKYSSKNIGSVLDTNQYEIKMDKIQKLKSIRNLFVQKDFAALNEEISKIIQDFEKYEQKILQSLSMTEDKTTFNNLYNKLIKNIRKENK